MDFREEILKEMSIAGYGDWNPSKEMVGLLSKFVLNKSWDYKDSITTNIGSYEVYENDGAYILGNMITSTEGYEQFEVDFRIDMKEHKSIANAFKLTKKLMNVDGVQVKPNKQGFGIATAMYKFLVKKEGYIILGDEIQYFGARKLWAKLSKSLDVKVDIIDIDTNKYLEKDVTLKHGTEDWDFDNRVWSYDVDKKHIRLLLKDIL